MHTAIYKEEERNHVAVCTQCKEKRNKELALARSRVAVNLTDCAGQ